MIPGGSQANRVGNALRGVPGVPVSTERHGGRSLQRFLRESCNSIIGPSLALRLLWRRSPSRNRGSYFPAGTQRPPGWRWSFFSTSRRPSLAPRSFTASVRIDGMEAAGRRAGFRLVPHLADLVLVGGAGLQGRQPRLPDRPGRVRDRRTAGGNLGGRRRLALAVPDNADVRHSGLRQKTERSCHRPLGFAGRAESRAPRAGRPPPRPPGRHGQQTTANRASDRATRRGRGIFMGGFGKITGKEGNRQHGIEPTGVARRMRAPQNCRRSESMPWGGRLIGSAALSPAAPPARP